MKSKKVILDTNHWISFLITKNYSFIDKFVDNQKVTLIFSKELIQEFLTVATRPKFQKYFTDQDIQKLLRSFDNFAKIIETTSNIEICRDFKDNFLLNLAIDSKADFLVTGDNDLLELKKIEKTKILTIRELTERKNINTTLQQSVYASRGSTAYCKLRFSLLPAHGLKQSYGV